MVRGKSKIAEMQQQFYFYNFVTNPTRQQDKICFTKTEKTAMRIFSMRFLGISTLLFFHQCLKTALLSEWHPSNSSRKRPTVTAYEKSRVSAKKWERGPPGEGLPFFRLTGPALFYVCLNGLSVLKVKLLGFIEQVY
jgi:hypothetical protein